jgi:hypothetical protein
MLAPGAQGVAVKLSMPHHAATSLSIAALTAASLLPSGAGAGPAVNGPRRITAASPYAPGCGTPIDAQGLGERIDETEAEPSLTVDRRDSRNLVTAWMVDLYRGYTSAWSDNSGAIWHSSVVPGISACSGDPAGYEVAADAWLSTGPDGTTYLSGIALDLNDVPNAVGPPFLPFRSRLQVSRSVDGGRTWSPPSIVVAGVGRLHDKPSVVADPQRPGYAYVAWTEFLTPLGPPAEGISFSRTTDHGATWSAPQHLDFPALPGATPIGALTEPLPDGSLVVLTTVRARNGTADPHRIYAMRTADAGDTWSAPVLVAEFPATNGRHSTPWDDPETGLAVDAPEWAISAAVGPNGTLYVTWRNSLPPINADVALSKSTDGGLTWSAPSTVASSGAQMWLPVIAVARDGTVGITYYDDRRDVLDQDGYTNDFWFSYSHDGAATWREIHVGGPFDLRTALLRKIPIQGYFLGDYHAMVAMPGGFESVFAMARPEAKVGGSDLFVARLRVSPSGVGTR